MARERGFRKRGAFLFLGRIGRRDPCRKVRGSRMRRRSTAGGLVKLTRAGLATRNMRSATSCFPSLFTAIAPTRLRPGMTAETERRRERGANQRPTHGQGMAGILLNRIAATADRKNRNGRSSQSSAKWRGNAGRCRRGEHNFRGEDGKAYEGPEGGESEKPKAGNPSTQITLFCAGSAFFLAIFALCATAYVAPSLFPRRSLRNFHPF